MLGAAGPARVASGPRWRVQGVLVLLLDRGDRTGWRRSVTSPACDAPHSHDRLQSTPPSASGVPIVCRNRCAVIVGLPFPSINPRPGTRP